MSGSNRVSKIPDLVYHSHRGRKTGGIGNQMVTYVHIVPYAVIGLGTPRRNATAEGLVAVLFALR
jgi:hypothetical protein